LWVLEQNTNAQAFYDERGGQCVERQCREPYPATDCGMRGTALFISSRAVKCSNPYRTEIRLSPREHVRHCARETRAIPMSEDIRPSDVSVARQWRQRLLTWIKRTW
jgi:hypothetical protein